MYSPIGLFFAGATSVVNVFTDVSRKKALARNDLFATTSWLRLIAAAVFTIAFLWHVHTAGPLHFVNDNTSPLGAYAKHLPAIVTFLLYLLADTSLVAVSVLIYYRALQISDLSLSVPLLSLTPAMLVLTGWLFLRETPPPAKLIGIGLVILGSLLMHKKAFRFGVLGPVKALFHEKSSRYMFYVACILSVTNMLDKKLVMLSDPFTQAFAYGLMLWFLLTMIALWQRPDWKAPLQRAPYWLLLAGVLDGGDLLLQFVSHKYIDVVTTITLKRAGVMLAVLAGWLIFHERHVVERLIASAVMLAGVLIIYLELTLRGSVLFAAASLAGAFLLTGWTGRWRSDGPTVSENSADSGMKRTSSKPSRQDRLRCAFIGCGGVSLHYLCVYRDLPWVDVAYCADIVPERARKAAELVSYGQARPARAVSDYRAALTDDVDIVVINTPNHVHLEQALASLEAGKHIFLQKPIAPTYEESLLMAQAANAQRHNGIIAGVYMSYLDQPAIQELIAMGQSGFFGEITQLHGRLMHPAGLQWSRQNIAGRNSNASWRSSVQQTGGGAFIQLAVHYIRLFCSITSEKIVSVDGYASNLLCPGVEGEDTASAVLRLSSGAHATVNLSWCSYGEELSIHGSKGSAVYLDNTDLTICSQNDWRSERIEYAAGPRKAFTFPLTNLGDAWSGYNQHAMFLNAVLRGIEPPVPLSAGVEDMAVVSAFYESVRTKRTVAVPCTRTEILEVLST